MSPEQTRGVDVDQRVDIWAFGVVLHEILTDELPFSGEYEAAIIYQILKIIGMIPSSKKFWPDQLFKN